MRRNTQFGFTMMESLVMVLITAIGMAITIPLFVSAMNDSKKKECRANMMAIANAEQQYKIKCATHSYTTVLTNLSGDFPAVPVCPNGGTYSVTISDGTGTSQSGQSVPAGGLIVQCSMGSDGKYAQTIDSQ